MSLIHNEQTKLSANWVNGVSLAIFGAGGFGPWITLAYPLGPHYDAIVLSLISLICILAAAGLHLTARAFLKQMKP